MVTRSELQEVFQHFAGRDQVLNRREFSRVLEFLGLPSTPRYVNSLLAGVDEDGSGDIDLDEFCSIFLPSGADSDDVDDEQESEARDVFDLFSRGDEVLSCGELKRALCSLGVQLSSKQAKKVLRDADEDGSGSLEFREFFALYRNLLSKQHPAQQEQEQSTSSMFEGAYPSSKKHEITKALMIGINYAGTDAALRGCVNDVRLMRNTIEKTLGIPIREARILVDEENFKGFTGLPKAQAIKDGLKWLAQGARAGDTLFLHYSGHGGTMKERVKGSEASGMDQCIFPMDYKTAGVVIDNDIYDTLVKVLPPGVRLTAVFDCCHSGSIMDLPFVATCDTRDVHRAANDTSCIPASVVMFAGCKDDQTSADAYQSEGTWGGALTYSLSSTLAEGKTLPVVQLLRKMQDALKGKYTQIPQLSSSHAFSTSGNFTLFGASTEEL